MCPFRWVPRRLDVEMSVEDYRSAAPSAWHPHDDIVAACDLADRDDGGRIASQRRRLHRHHHRGQPKPLDMLADARDDRVLGFRSSSGCELAPGAARPNRHCRLRSQRALGGTLPRPRPPAFSGPFKSGPKDRLRARRGGPAPAGGRLDRSFPAGSGDSASPKRTSSQ